MIANLRETGADYFLLNANREGRQMLPDDPYIMKNLEPVLAYKGIYLFRVRR